MAAIGGSWLSAPLLLLLSLRWACSRSGSRRTTRAPRWGRRCWPPVEMPAAFVLVVRSDSGVKGLREVADTKNSIGYFVGYPRRAGAP